MWIYPSEWRGRLVWWLRLGTLVVCAGASALIGRWLGHSDFGSACGGVICERVVALLVTALTCAAGLVLTIRIPHLVYYWDAVPSGTTLYHLTSQGAATAMRADGRIRAGRPWNFAGAGVYVTDSADTGAVALARIGLTGKRGHIVAVPVLIRTPQRVRRYGQYSYRIKGDVYRDALSGVFVV